MIINKLNPQGFCNGVKRAIDIAIKSVNDKNVKKPIYMLGALIHNSHVIKKLEDLGIIIIDEKNKTRLELLDLIPNNNGSVLVSAHGASNAVFEKIRAKGLDYIDATCGCVSLIHKKVLEYIKNDYEILYIGTNNHPECEGVLGLSNNIKLITTPSDLDLINTNKNIYATNQTTLSKYEVDDIYNKIKNKYPNSIIDDSICNATTERQNAILKADLADLCIIVGDKRSANTNKLKDISINRGMKTLLVSDLDELKPLLPNDINSVIVTSGASCPDEITNEIIKYLETK